MLVILLTGSLNLTVNIEAQRAVWFIIPLFPIFVVFFIGSVAETNRAPFDLAEAESELVSGFMTEHAAVIFVFFFLAEYASIVLICLLISILFLGGYLLNLMPLIYLFALTEYIFTCIIASIYFLGGYILNLMPITDLFEIIDYKLIMIDSDYYLSLLSDPLIEGMLYGLILGVKTCIMIFIFVWVRASFPRIRFDQLMSFCWTILLPLVIAFIILVPCILYSFEIIPSNIYLF